MCVVMTGLVVALLYLYHASSRPLKLVSTYARVPPPPPPPPRYRERKQTFNYLKGDGGAS